MTVHLRRGACPVPRITDERRAANRAQIVAAARRCFSRDGFHQTSMPDIAAEAGVSAGPPTATSPARRRSSSQSPARPFA
ncbi:helix-turn-helix domain-containing protein [Streptomyces sp. NPDC101733]|uniref:helix-turn-helix domain-containing protein n=1 Tax=unclassified Streptomyces TaxID=2593676 RepID=UPI0037F38D27